MTRCYFKLCFVLFGKKSMQLCEKFHQVETKTILTILIQPKTTLFIDVSASHRKPSSGLTSGAGRQYVEACPIRGSTGSSPHLDSCCPSSWSILPPLWVCQLCLILDQPPWRSPIANMTCDCRFVADTGCPGLFCSSEDSCDTIRPLVNRFELSWHVEIALTWSQTGSGHILLRYPAL